jgi:hypothetical protein
MHMFAKTCDTDANHNVRGAMNPAGRVRCNMENQIRLANHNCNFYRLKARVLLPSTPFMTHSVCVVANPGPPAKQALGGSGPTRSAPCLICALG